MESCTGEDLTDMPHEEHSHTLIYRQEGLCIEFYTEFSLLCHKSRHATNTDPLHQHGNDKQI